MPFNSAFRWVDPTNVAGVMEDDPTANLEGVGVMSEARFVDARLRVLSGERKSERVDDLHIPMAESVRSSCTFAMIFSGFAHYLSNRPAAGTGVPCLLRQLCNCTPFPERRSRRLMLYGVWLDTEGL